MNHPRNAAEARCGYVLWAEGDFPALGAIIKWSRSELLDETRQCHKNKPWFRR